MRWLMIAVLVCCSASLADERWSAVDSTKWSAVDSTKWSAIESKPLWERPAMGLSLQRETEIVLDRGNGRIEDSYTFELRRLDAERAIARDAWNGSTGRARFEVFQRELERAREIDRARARAAAQEQRVKVVEVESQRLAAERERWMKQMAKPRHAEGAVVDRQSRSK